MTEGLLAIALNTAVPLWALELQSEPWEYLESRARICGQIVASKGDIIQFKSQKKGETAEAFNRLAEGIAIMSFIPGGVDAFGSHFENHHPQIKGYKWRWLRLAGMWTKVSNVKLRKLRKRRKRARKPRSC